MNTRWTSWLAVSLWTIAMLCAMCELTLTYANGKLIDDLRHGGNALFYLAIVASLGTVGVLLAVHRPGNAIGWIFLTAALSNGIGGIASEYAVYLTETSPGGLPELPVLIWLGAWIWIPLFALPPSFGILLFPTGRLPSRRWRPFAWFIGIYLGLWIIAAMLNPGPADSDPTSPLAQFENPGGIESLARICDFILAPVDVVGLVTLGGAVASIFARLRGAADVERRQIKWFAYAASCSLISVASYEVIVVLAGISTSGTVDGYIWLLGITLLPIAIGIAILRHNLYDIDRLINRTLVYGGLTALLALGFAGSVIFFQFLLSPVTSGNDLSIAGSTLVVAALFRPARGRIQALVDRRFYRRKYDAQQTLAAFSVIAREAVDLDELAGELIAVVAVTMHPEHISVWLRRATPSGKT